MNAQLIVFDVYEQVNQTGQLNSGAALLDEELFGDGAFLDKPVFGHDIGQLC